MVPATLLQSPHPRVPPTYHSPRNLLLLAIKLRLPLLFLNQVLSPLAPQLGLPLLTNQLGLLLLASRGLRSALCVGRQNTCAEIVLGQGGRLSLPVTSVSGASEIIHGIGARPKVSAAPSAKLQA